MEEIGMKMTKHGLSEKEKELVQLLMAECKSTSDIQEKLKGISKNYFFRQISELYLQERSLY